MTYYCPDCTRRHEKGIPCRRRSPSSSLWDCPNCGAEEHAKELWNDTQLRSYLAALGGIDTSSQVVAAPEQKIQRPQTTQEVMDSFCDGSPEILAVEPERGYEDSEQYSLSDFPATDKKEIQAEEFTLNLKEIGKLTMGDKCFLLKHIIDSMCGKEKKAHIRREVDMNEGIDFVYADHNAIELDFEDGHTEQVVSIQDLEQYSLRELAGAKWFIWEEEE